MEKFAELVEAYGSELMAAKASEAEDRVRCPHEGPGGCPEEEPFGVGVCLCPHHCSEC